VGSTSLGEKKWGSLNAGGVLFTTKLSGERGKLHRTKRGAAQDGEDSGDEKDVFTP